MKKLLLLSVLLALVALPTVTRADQTEEDAAIHQLNDNWNAAWNKHDPKLMAAFWDKDGDLINPFGRHAKGTADLEKLFTEEQTGIMAGTTYTGTIESIRYVGKHVAIVDVDAEITGMKGLDGAAAPPFKHHVTWIAREKDDKWQAVSVRAFALIPPPPPVR